MSPGSLRRLRQIGRLAFTVVALSTGASAQEMGARVEEIVVTARKRKELLIDTPVAVTALDAEQLNANGVTRLNEIEDLVPNLTFQTSFTGQDALILVRGVGTATIEPTFDPGVGIYVDGVYLPRAQGAVLDIADIQQIEVLRGPQGTLFGKNTVGGAINVTTVPPQEDFEARLSFTGGNFETFRVHTMLNAPIGGGFLKDKLFGRFNFLTNQSEGYTKNVGDPEFVGGLSGTRYNDRNQLSFFGTLHFLATDDVDASLTGSWSRDNTHGRGGECKWVERDGRLPLAVLIVDPRFESTCRHSQPLRFSSDVHPIQQTESYGTWATIRWSVGSAALFDDLALKSITSFREQRQKLRNDVDMTDVSVVQLAHGLDGGINGEPDFSRQVTQELQANATAWDDRINVVGGLFGFWEESSLRLVQTAPVPLGDFATTFNDTRTENWDLAVYGQETTDFTDWLSLTLGLRWTIEHKAASKNTISYAGENSIDGANQDTYSAFSPLVTLALTAPDSLLDKVSFDHSMAYFTWSRGFKGGGFNATTGQTVITGPGVTADTLSSFSPEFLDNLELGFKVEAFERRLGVNTALFLGFYDDIQVATTRNLGDIDGDGLDNFERVVENAAKATIMGAEVESWWRPVDELLLTANLSLLESRYDEYISTDDVALPAIPGEAPPARNRAGESFNRVPKQKYNAAVQYSIPIEPDRPDWLWGELTPRVDWSYRSKVHYFGPELVEATQRGFNLLNARLTYEFNDSRSQIALWAKNLTDERHFDDAFTLATVFNTVTRFYGEPRTYGIEITHNF